MKTTVQGKTEEQSDTRIMVSDDGTAYLLISDGYRYDYLDLNSMETIRSTDKWEMREQDALEQLQIHDYSVKPFNSKGGSVTIATKGYRNENSTTCETKGCTCKKDD